jgi:transcriptional regulator with XRE-family HTH domain
MNQLVPEKRAQLKRLLAAGMSLRQIAQEVGCAKNTVLRYAHMSVVRRRCPCGQEAIHRGWCSWRLQFSYQRREWLRKHWGRSSHAGPLSESIDAAVKAAKQNGHELGRFVWTAELGASLAYSRCRRCWKPVRILSDGLQGTALRQPCYTAAEVAAITKARQELRKEKRSWHDGKQTLSQLRKVLRDQSNSQIEEFRQALTSHP